VDAPLWAPGEEWRLSEEPLATVGAVDGPEAIGTVGRLTEESGVALLDGGGIAVADGQANEIRIYDAYGTRLATMGRAGDGPGEFRGLRGIATFGGDSLLAWDSRAGFYVGRLSVFTSAGAVVRTLPTTALRIGDVLGVAEDGTLLVEPQQSNPPDWRRPDAGVYRDPRLYQSVSASGELLGTFGPFPGTEWFAADSERRAIVYYTPNTYATVGRRVVYIGDGERFEIAVHDPATGQVLRHLRRPYDPVPVTAEQLAGRRDVARRGNAITDSLGAQRPELLQRARARRVDPEDIPARETHPAFNRIIEDADENLWVRHAVASADSVQTWSVFDREGSWLGEVDIPIQMSVRAIGSAEIAVVVRDELRVEYVHLFRLLKQ
jgi:hypothetical protein